MLRKSTNRSVVTGRWFNVGMQYLEEMANKQRNLVSRKQLINLGMSEKQIEWALARRYVIPVFRGVYRLPGLIVTKEVMMLAATMAAGAESFVSHRAAARLWDLTLPRNKLDVTIDGARKVSLPEVAIHRSNTFDILKTTVRGIPVSTVARTLIDCSSMFQPILLEKAAEDAIVRGLTTFREIAEALDAVQRRGRRRISYWHEILDERTDLADRNESVLAQRIYRVIVNAGLPTPEREWQVVSGGKVRYLDMAYPELRINIECDGKGAHQTVRFDDDRRRDRSLQNDLWQVLRFTAKSTDTEIIADVSTAIRNRAAA